MITFQVLKVAGGGEDILATKGTYLDALADVVTTARRYPGTRLVPTLNPHVWVVRNERAVRRNFLLRVREVRR